MIERLIVDEGGEALSFLKREPALNTFIIGDYQNCGLTGREDVKFFVSKKNGNVNGILMLFRQWLHFSFPYNGDKEETRQLVSSLGIEHLKLNGSSASFDLIGAKTRRPCHLVTLYKKDWKSREKKAEAVKLGPKDARDINNIYGKITEFDNWKLDDEEQIANQRKDMERNETVDFGIRENGELVSCAGLSGISTVSGMIIGVCTLSEYRRRGYASSTLYSLLDYAFDTLSLECVSLFWDNGVAGKMYSDAGFKDTGEYLMGALD